MLLPSGTALHGARQGYAKALLDRVGVVPSRLEPPAELFPDSVERKVFAQVVASVAPGIGLAGGRRFPNRCLFPSKSRPSRRRG